jgi:hypothetical protein
MEKNVQYRVSVSSWIMSNKIEVRLTTFTEGLARGLRRGHGRRYGQARDSEDSESEDSLSHGPDKVNNTVSPAKKVSPEKYVRLLATASSDMETDSWQHDSEKHVRREFGKVAARLDEVWKAIPKDHEHKALRDKVRGEMEEMEECLNGLGDWVSELVRFASGEGTRPVAK